jgi:hypothetical protein
LLKKIHKTNIYKLSARLLLIVFAMHVLSVHSLAESLVYCFEENGDVNIESITDFGILFESEADVHEEESHDHERNSVFHKDNDNHRDIPLTLLCAKEDKLNRFDQQKAVADLISGFFQRVEISPSSRFAQRKTFIPPIIENPLTLSLQTVVLLN